MISPEFYYAVCGRKILGSTTEHAMTTNDAVQSGLSVGLRLMSAGSSTVHYMDEKYMVLIQNKQ